MRNTLQQDIGIKMNNDNICICIGIKIYGEIFILGGTKLLKKGILNKLPLLADQ